MVRPVIPRIGLVVRPFILQRNIAGLMSVADRRKKLQVRREYLNADFARHAGKEEDCHVKHGHDD
jgi:hypothetical protein